jgi:hypothetical protein
MQNGGKYKMCLYDINCMSEWSKQSADSVCISGALGIHLSFYWQRSDFSLYFSLTAYFIRQCLK